MDEKNVEKTNIDKRLRISVYRSLKHFYAQIIDDDQGKTLVSVSDIEIPKKVKDEPTKKVFIVGEILAKKAKSKKIKKCFLDRKNYKYQGALKAFAEGARKGGLEF